MAFTLGKKEQKISLEGTINKINQIVFHIDAIETWLDIQCTPAQVRAAEEAVEEIGKTFSIGYSPFNTLFAPKDDINRELRFIGMLHADVVGLSFKFEAKLQDAYEPGRNSAIYIVQTLKIPGKPNYISNYIMRPNG
jgi:hypothetical protein